MTVSILIGDVREQLRTLAAGSVHMVVTSPPYWGLRAYGTDPQIWGGDPMCAHEWGASLRRHKGGPHGAGAQNLDVLPAVVLDPFGGSGTTGMVANQYGRDSVLIELNPDYAKIAKRRISKFAGIVDATIEDEADTPGPLFEFGR